MVRDFRPLGFANSAKLQIDGIGWWKDTIIWMSAFCTLKSGNGNSQQIEIWSKIQKEVKVKIRCNATGIIEILAVRAGYTIANLWKITA